MNTSPASCQNHGRTICICGEIIKTCGCRNAATNTVREPTCSHNNERLSFDIGLQGKSIIIKFNKPTTQVVLAGDNAARLGSTLLQLAGQVAMKLRMERDFYTSQLKRSQSVD